MSNEIANTDFMYFTLIQAHALEDLIWNDD